MKHYTSKGRGRCAALALALPLVAGVPAMAFVPSSMVTISQTASAISGVNQLNATTFEVRYQNGQVLTIDFYGENIFRLFQDNKGGKMRNPQAQPPAQILVDNPRKSVEHINLTKDNGYYIIATPKVQLRLNATSGLLSVLNGEGTEVVRELAAANITDAKTTLTFAAQPNEYFYGGGVQNGRFSHRGKSIAIENTNNWVDGGVASPTPFYWSTKGYGLLWHTFKPGRYDFGAEDAKKVTLSH